MSREGRTFWAVLLSTLTLLPGCTPSRTFYFHESGELSHYKGMATNIEYPDVESATLAEVDCTLPPVTLRNIEDYQFWDLTLEEALHTTLTNSKVVRLLAGGSGGSVGTLLQNPEQSPTVYEHAIQQSNPGLGGRIGGGVESALSAFDAQLSASMLWERNEAPQNINPGNFVNQAFFRPDSVSDNGTFQAQIAKQSASGAQFAVRNNTIYSLTNSPNREVPSDYTTNFEVEARQPLLQGRGALFNRIAGPGLGPGNYNGVVIARINGDITLADFEGQVQNQVRQVEDTYWDLYAAYRVFDAAREGRDNVLQAWRRVNALAEVGAVGGDALSVARAQQEYLLFKSQTEDALTRLYAIENRLRYLMGLSATDGRLIRPREEPVTARLEFDWCQIHNEALARQVNLRRQKWQIKRVEMELIAARNFLLPRLDGVARYRWLGVGDDLIDPNGRGIGEIVNNQRIRDTDAFSTLTDGNYQEWELGLQFNMPLGFRRELAGVRNTQLRLARERAVLQDQELEVSHLLTEAIRNLHSNHVISETLFNRGIAAKREVDAAQAIFDQGAELQQAGPSILDRLLDAQRRRAEAERDYYRTLVQYAKSITEVHFRKGSILEYNNVFLAEGPWPCKAYIDAYDRARQRDAGHYVDYGFTRPSVISRGPYDQFGGQIFGHDGSMTPSPAEQVPPPKNDGRQEEMPDPYYQPSQPSVLQPGERPTLGPSLGFGREDSTPALQPPEPGDAAPSTAEEAKTRPVGFRPPRPLSRP